MEVRKMVSGKKSHASLKMNNLGLYCWHETLECPLHLPLYSFVEKFHKVNEKGQQYMNDYFMAILKQMLLFNVLS